MAEPIDWLADGTPFSPRFSDRYGSEAGGPARARQVFLQGCGLPLAWAGQPQWRVLETGFGLGLSFLLTWQAWRADLQRPRLLHFVAIEAFPASADDVLRAAAAHPDLLPLAEQLQAQWQGLLPGVHRLAFDGGQVLLTLGIGEVKTMLKAQAITADSVYLNGFSQQRNPDIWDAHTLKAVARCCRRGTRLASWRVSRSVMDALMQCGFEVQETPGMAPKRDTLQASFAPRWEPRKAMEARPPQAQLPTHCVVIGAGLAGAACAASLARRGWRVTVLDAHAAAAGGASGLPAGMLAPHVSPDDSPLSRLSRSGLRATWQQVRTLLAAGTDWQASGVLQRRFDASGALPACWPEAGAHWSRPASAAECAALQPRTAATQNDPARNAENAGDAGDAKNAKNDAAENAPADAHGALWHASGGWIKPARLVQALLRTPGVQARYGVQVARLERAPASGPQPHWQLFDASGHCLAQAALVVLAAGFETAGLLAHAVATSGTTAPSPQPDPQPQPQPTAALTLPLTLPLPVSLPGARLPLQPMRGQVAWGRHADAAGAVMPPFTAPPPAFMPPFPVNGDGSFIPSFAGAAPGATHWLMGATFERGSNSTAPSAADQQAIAQRLQRLLPATGAGLQALFDAGGAQAWAGVRCVSPDRLPLVGPLDEAAWPGLWACTALGSRGLTFAVLCAELLAAWLHAEPLPVEKRLAQALLANRFGAPAGAPTTTTSTPKQPTPAPT